MIYSCSTPVFDHFRIMSARERAVTDNRGFSTNEMIHAWASSGRDHVDDSFKNVGSIVSHLRSLMTQRGATHSFISKETL